MTEQPDSEVTVRACSSPADCEAVAALCGSSFPEECWGQGLSVQQWASIEAEDLRNRKSWWRQIGLACEGSKVLGVVVLTLENEEDDSISWSEYSRRVGCGPTILSMMYDHVLEEPLREHQCLIDFIAVSPDARGKGVGAKLMQWAEQAGTCILAETETAAVAAHGVEMVLWVAADNSVACRLYQRHGYNVEKRTDSGACQCMASRVLKWFLGHPVWIKMRKPLPAPEHLAVAKPEPVSISLVAAAGTGAQLAQASAAAESQFVNVPLEPVQQQLPRPPALKGRSRWHRQQQPPTPVAGADGAAASSSPVGSLLQKLSLGMFAAQGGWGHGSTMPVSSLSACGSLAHTPKIGALPITSCSVGQLQPEPASAMPAAGRRGCVGRPRKGSTAGEGQCVELQCVELQAAGLSSGQAPGLNAGKLAALDAVAASLQPRLLASIPPSVASASVASLGAESSDSEPSSPMAAQPSDVFQLVALNSTTSISGAARVPA